MTWRFAFVTFCAVRHMCGIDAERREHSKPVAGAACAGVRAQTPATSFMAFLTRLVCCFFRAFIFLHILCCRCLGWCGTWSGRFISSQVVCGCVGAWAVVNGYIAHIKLEWWRGGNGENSRKRIEAQNRLRTGNGFVEPNRLRWRFQLLCCAAQRFCFFSAFVLFSVIFDHTRNAMPSTHLS